MEKGEKNVKFGINSVSLSKLQNRQKKPEPLQFYKTNEKYSTSIHNDKEAHSEGSL